MVSDNSEMVPTSDVKVDDVLKISAAIGGGIGAQYAFAQGGLVGTALITAWGAGALGVGAAGVAGWEVGTAIGETELVRDALVHLMEWISPIRDSADKPIVECSWAPGENFTANFGGEVVEVSFYVDVLGQEGLSADANFNAGLELYSDPHQAFWAAEEIKIIGGDYWMNECNGIGVILS